VLYFSSSVVSSREAPFLPPLASVLVFPQRIFLDRGSGLQVVVLRLELSLSEVPQIAQFYTVGESHHPIVGTVGLK
jgi:hypothetical protein